MNDKQWLEKVSLAYKVYADTVEGPKLDIEKFIKWLYEQYGILESNKDNK
jgi:hypothetical protein